MTTTPVVDRATLPVNASRTVTTTTVLPTRLTITGAEARELDRHVSVYVRPTWSWREVQGMNECNHGCKLYARQRGAVRQYQLWHSTSYGCVLGHDVATRTVPVSVRPRS